MSPEAAAYPRDMSDQDRAAKPSADLGRDIELARGAHRRLDAALNELISTDGFDVAAPSRLPDWTKGHVLTHIANSGIGHVGIFDGAARGEVTAQYPHGVEGRAADIEAGAVRPAREQIDAFRDANEQLEERYATTDWRGTGTSPRGGEVPITDLPFFRTREVTIHHIDLDIGFEFDDLPPDYLRLELRRMEMLWTARQPMGLTPLPAAALALTPPHRLSWFMGRANVDGLAPADVF